jgi:hypothetical protein
MAGNDCKELGEKDVQASTGGGGAGTRTFPFPLPSKRTSPENESDVIKNATHGTALEPAPLRGTGESLTGGDCVQLRRSFGGIDRKSSHRRGGVVATRRVLSAR